MDIKIGDIVEITEIYVPGVVEGITDHGDLVIYSIRCPYTGTLHSAESEDIELMSDEAAGKVRQDMQRFAPVVAECEIMKVCVDGFVITRGMVNAEMARTAAARSTMARSASPMLVIGLNASSNMFA